MTTSRPGAGATTLDGATPLASAVVDLVVESDERVGEGGFLELRRVELRNRRGDGSVSARYGCEFVHRAYGQDAVVVVIYRRDDRGEIQVLLRDGLRPALWLGRDPQRAPLPELAPGMFHRELVAGIIEQADVGLDGLLRRAIAECEEEAGVQVTAAQLRSLGAGTLPSPGSMLEKFYFVAAEVPAAGSAGSGSDAPHAAAAARPPAGDGSPMEDDARLCWMELDAAIAAAVAGELTDAKTELGLRRLRDDLAPPGGPPSHPGAR